MTFLTLVGGVVIFGLLTLLFPRTSFVVLLGTYNICQGTGLFPSVPGPNWETLATIIIAVGGIIALVLDVSTVYMISEEIKKS